MPSQRQKKRKEAGGVARSLELGAAACGSN